MIRLIGLCLCIINLSIQAPPMRQVPIEPENLQATPAPQEHQEQPRKPYEFTYEKYLQEVVKILESDPKFSEKLKTMNEDDIKAGNVADHIDDLDAAVFERLHKAKIAEIQRLREQIEQQIKDDGGAHNVKMPEHLELRDVEKFNKEDLRKLIKKTVADMEAIDEERKKEFKEYELKKQAEKDHQYQQMTEEEKQKVKQENDEALKRHNEHEKLKHPGSRDQLEQVWEENDKLDKETFDSRTFFALHDLNGDGYWSDMELEALFQLELEKMYNDTNPDDDPKEKMEEMYRMREHVSKQMDKNGDRLISLEEFLADTEAQTPNVDPGWKDLGQEQAKVYTDEELQAFEKEYAKQQGWDMQTSTIAAPADRSPQVVHEAVPAQAVPVQHAPVTHAPIVEQAKDSAYGI